MKMLKTGMLLTFLMILGSFIRTQTLIYPPDYRIPDFPLLIQSDSISCGPTAVAMVLRFYNKNIPLDDIKTETKTKWFNYDGKDYGMTLPTCISKTLKNHDIRIRMGLNNPQELKYWISHNHPVIILIRKDNWSWHYLVVIGYKGDTLIVADPAAGFIRNLPIESVVLQILA